MIKWDVFKYLYSNDLQNSYQTMCYYLFCQQHGINEGVFAYTNQPYIETNPISVDKEIIGFQSKFYDGNICTHSKELKELLLSAKSKYKEITRIEFYLHGEFYASSDKEKVSPKYKEELESYADTLGITIDWMVDSNLEYIINLPKNSYIKEIFFDPDCVLKKYIEILFSRTAQYIESKSSEIWYKGNKIKINIDHTIDQLDLSLSEKKQFICVQGGAGSGKTAVLKDWYLNQNNKFPILLFSPVQFDVSDAINFAGGNVNKNIFDIINLYRDERKKIVIIDSSEKITNIKYTDVFVEIIRKFYDANWQIIFSCRSAYVENLKNLLIDCGFPNDLLKIQINQISEENIKEILNDNDMALPLDGKLLFQLQNPFYLDKYIRSYNSDINKLDYDEFIKLVWNDCIRNEKIIKNSLNIKREDVFLSILNEGILKNRFYVNCGTYDGEAIECLKQDEIIALAENSNDCYVNYDIFEEWGLQRIIDNAYRQKAKVNEFYVVIGDSLAMRKAFKCFSNKKLEEGNVSYINFLYQSLNNTSISNLWKDEILVCYLKSDNAEVLLNQIKNMFSINEYELFIKALNLLLVACKCFKDEKALLYKLDRYIFLQPTGSGWLYLIKYSLKEFEDISKRNNILILLINIIHEWTVNYMEGETTKFAGTLAIKILDFIEDNDLSYMMGKNLMNNLYITIANSAKEQYEEINKILATITNTWELKRDTKYREFAEFILSESIRCTNLCVYCPDALIKMCEKCWLKIPIDKNAEFPYYISSNDEVEDWFDLNNYSSHDYFPASAFLTPILNMLRSRSIWKVVDFIIKFTNHTVECYSKSKAGNYVENLILNVDGESIEQLCDDRIWNMYRGTQVSTNLLESIHMALELFLFECAEQLGASSIRLLLKYLLKNSHSASLTAIALSVAMSYPNDLFDISYILMQTKQIFFYDIRRYVLDKNPPCVSGHGIYASLYQNERINANKRECRSKKFEEIIFNYLLVQNDLSNDMFKEIREKVFKVIDNFYEQLKYEKDNSLAMLLARIDLRTMKIEPVEINGERKMAFQSCPSRELKKISDDAQVKSQIMEESCNFMVWANKKYKRETFDKQEAYTDSKSIYNRINKILNRKEDDGLGIFDISASYQACAILIRDYNNDLTKEELKQIYCYCYEQLQLVLNHQYNFQCGDGIDAVFDTLIMFTNLSYKNENLTAEIIRAIVLLHEQRTFNYEIIKKIYINKNKETIKVILNYYIEILQIYYDDKNFKSNEKFYDKFDRLTKSLSKLDFTITNIAWFNFNDAKIEILIIFFKLLDTDEINESDLAQLLESINNKYLEARKYTAQRNQSRYISLYNFSVNIANILLNSNYNVKLLLSKIEGMLFYEDILYKILSQLIFAEDKINQHDRFWEIWNAFYPYVKLYVNKYMVQGHSNNAEINVATYFFAGNEWGEKQIQWHSFNKEDCSFIDKIIFDFKLYSITLYSISKLLNTIAFNYEEEGLEWCYNILLNNDKLKQKAWLENTSYYLLNFIQRLISKKGRKIKSDVSLRFKVVECLDSLILKGESRAYLLRENL